MKRKTKLGALLCIMLLAVCLCATGAAAFADSSDDEVIVYKSLVSTGAAGAGEVQWGESGAPDSWAGAVEEIRDSDQPDGGDVILRTELDTAGTNLVSSEVGFARESTSFDKAAYPMNGFTMKFYHQGTSNVMFIFTKNSGWYGGSDTYWSIWFQGKNAALRVMNGKGDFEVKANAAVKTFYSDYEYLSDPDTQGYAAVGDNTKAFAGTENVFEIKPDGGNLCAFLNEQKLFDLTQQGVVADVFDKSDARGMFLSYWKPGSAVFAMKITDIYNVKSSWESGVPATYETNDAAAVENKVTEAGTVQFRSKESANYDFGITYKTAQYFADLTSTFTYDGTRLNSGDTLGMIFTDSGAAADKLELEFAKKSDTSASLTVKKDGAAVGNPQDVSFSYNGTSINTVSIKETVPFVLTVNGNNIEIEQSAFTAMKSAIAEGKVKVGYEVKGSELSMLTPVAYNSSAVVTYDKVDGLTVSGDVTIKSDGNYRMIYNSDDSGYTAAYTANKLIADSFTVSYKFGKYGANEQPLRVSIGDTNNSLVFELVPVAGRTDEATLNLYVNGASDKKVASETVEFNWEYECGVRSLGFVNDGGAAYLAFIDGDVAMSVSGNGIADIAAVIDSFTGKMANITFTVADEALTAFAFCDYDYYVGKANAGGWGEGAIPKMQFGYDADDNAVLIFDNAYSYQKNREVPVDGFTMTFKTYAKSGSGSPTWAIASSTAWYSNTSAIMFGISKRNDTKATFSIMYTNKIAGDYDYISDSAENKNIVSYTVDWNWNNGIDNTIALNCTDGVWRWTVNDTVLAPEPDSDEDYSDYIAEVYSTFASADKTGVVQIFGGANMVWNISDMSEFEINVDPTVKNPTLKTSYAIGEEITVNLGEVFSDANGDVLTYVLSDETAYGAITEGVWKFTPDAEGLYTVIIEAYDGKGGEATLTLTVNVEKEQSANNGGGNGKKKSCGSDVGAGAFASVAIVLLAAAAVMLKRKISVK